jgi:nucleotide-binding universal stress UspA family protein
MLIPLDGSALAEAAVPVAAQIGKALGWSAVLYSVVEREETSHRLYAQSEAPIEAGPDVRDRMEGRYAARDEQLQQEQAGAIDLMAPAAQRLEAAGVRVEREVGVGHPRDTIVTRAAEDDVALIVMASHGRTGLARLFRGSIAAGVAEHAHRAVLLVRPFRDAAHRLDFENRRELSAEEADQVFAAANAALT